jgi:ATP-binding cassette subfamily F protein 3
VLFSSHDRTFASLVATGIVEIKNGQAKRRHEDYNDYVAALEKELARKQSEKLNAATEAAERNTRPDREKYLENKARQKQIQTLEKDLAKMQAYKTELLEYFLEHYQNYRPEKVTELEELKRRIADKEDLWLMLSEENKDQ